MKDSYNPTTGIISPQSHSPNTTALAEHRQYESCRRVSPTTVQQVRPHDLTEETSTRHAIKIQRVSTRYSFTPKLAKAIRSG